MDYDFDIFLSYRRSAMVGQWVRNHLLPCLEERLENVAPRPVRISCDSQMEGGSNWPAELKQRLQHSALLLPVWSADYFRSRWCMAEWGSFRKREETLGLFSTQNPQGLVYPVRYADGEYFHPDAQNTQVRRDFSHLNFPYESFKSSEKYLVFDTQVQEMAQDLVQKIQTVPPWRANFPLVEPEPMAPLVLPRPKV